VGEILDADVASLYTFDEEGEVLIGRKRIVFRDVGPVTERLRSEDVRQIRAPVAMLPGLAEAVATGEPHMATAASDLGPLSTLSAASESPAASLTVPLLVRGHVVGVASWDTYREEGGHDGGVIAFAQALGATAAAALHTAELFASLETARAEAEREALRFGALIDQMADGVVVVDANGQVERTNAAAGSSSAPPSRPCRSRTGRSASTSSASTGGPSRRPTSRSPARCAVSASAGPTSRSARPGATSGSSPAPPRRS
jgi:GAF domain-containing protein